MHHCLGLVHCEKYLSVLFIYLWDPNQSNNVSINNETLEVSLLAENSYSAAHRYAWCTWAYWLLLVAFSLHSLIILIVCSLFYWLLLTTISIINHFRKHFYSFCRLICWIQVSYATWKVVFKFISYYLAIVECILTIYVLIAERAKTTEVVSTKVFPESKHARSESEHYPHLFCCNFMLCGIILEFQLAISKLT